MSASADTAACVAFGSWDPNRPPKTHRQFAPLTKLPGGPLKGSPCDPSTDPVQAWVIEQLDSGHWSRIFWAAPPQIAGKTQIAVLVPAMRAVIELKAAVGYGLPTLHDLDRGWQTKVAPTIKDAGLGEYLPQRGPGSKGGRPPSVTFEDPNDNRAALGSFVFLAGGAKQVTVRVVVVDEIDAWRDADGTPRWSDLEDVWARADSFQGEAIRIGVGTVEIDDPAKSIVLACVNEHGTGTRLWARCPHCQTFGTLEWDHFIYEYRTTGGDRPGPDLRHAAATAAYSCPRCAVRWSEDDRRSALRASRFAHKGQTVDAAGIVVGPPPQTDALGLRTHALDCILTTMGVIAEKHAAARFALDAHQNHEPMRKFWRYQRVEGYQGDKVGNDARIENTTQALAAISAASSARRGVLTDGIDNLTVAVDCQLRQHYWMAVAHRGDEHWIVDWGAEALCAQGIDPTPDDRKLLMDKLRDLARERWGLAASICGVDLGGGGGKGGPDWGETLHAWLGKNKGSWIGMRGVGDYTAMRISEQMRTKWYEVGESGILLANADPLKAYAAQALRRTSGTPVVHLPSGLAADDWLLKSLTAERREQTDKGPVWVKLYQRNDWWDCLIYNLALARYRAGVPAPGAISLPGIDDPFFRRMR